MGINGSVYALAAHDGILFAGGFFTAAGGMPANNVAAWDGTSWSALGSGITGTSAEVFALTAGDNLLYVGGFFTAAGGVPALDLAVWDGGTWSALGPSVSGGTGNPGVLTLLWSGATLYVGGNFTYAGDVLVNNIAAWNGTGWSALGSGVTAA